MKRFFDLATDLNGHPITGDQHPVKTRKSLSAFIGLSVGIVLGICLPVRAQISGGIVAGTITDSSGAVISSAKIKATNEATHVATETRSGSTGAYRFIDIPVGVYSVTVDAPGFETTSNSSVVVQLQTTTTLNLTLRVGATTQTVDVTTASAPGRRFSTMTIFSGSPKNIITSSFTPLSPHRSLRTTGRVMWGSFMKWFWKDTCTIAFIPRRSNTISAARR